MSIFYSTATCTLVAAIATLVVVRRLVAAVLAAALTAALAASTAATATHSSQRRARRHILERHTARGLSRLDSLDLGSRHILRAVATAHAATTTALAAHQVAHGRVGVASHGVTDAVNTAQTLLYNVTGGVGYSASGVASSLQQVADRAVQGAEQATSTAGVATILAAIAAGVAAVATIGHLRSTLYTKKRNSFWGSENVKAIHKGKLRLFGQTGIFCSTVCQNVRNTRIAIGTESGTNC